jgi:hypothetical protein
MRERPDPDQHTSVVIRSHATTGSGFKLLYEVDNTLGHLVPHLRLIVDKGIDVDTVVSETYVGDNDRIMT